MNVSWPLGIILLILAWFVIAAIRAQIQRPLSGPDAVVGTFGIARTDINPEGRVEVRGMRWRAHTSGPPIARGSAVKVSGVSGLTLLVEQVEPRTARGSKKRLSRSLITGLLTGLLVWATTASDGQQPLALLLLPWPNPSSRNPSRRGSRGGSSHGPNAELRASEGPCPKTQRGRESQGGGTTFALGGEL